MNKAFIGIDIGTSSVKAAVVGVSEGILGIGRASYRTYSCHPGWSEQDPEQWWGAAVSAVHQALDEARSIINISVTGIGVTGQMHSFVLVDKNHRVIRNAVTWMDTRSKGLVREIQSGIDNSGFTNKTWNRVSPGLTLATLYWLRKNEPASLDRAAALLTAKDYIRLKLTGSIGADPTDGSATLLMDVPARRWLPELLTLFQLPPDMLPPLSEPWEYAGDVIPRYHTEFGGTQGSSISVAVGSGDQQAAALANSIIHTGEVQIMLGTGCQIASPIHQVPPQPVDGLNLFCHHTKWLLQASVQNGGSALTWAQKAFNAHWSEYEEAIDSTSIQEAPFFLPYLMGERTSMIGSNAAGCWLNIYSSTTRQDILYASIEGVVFGIADALDRLREHVTCISNVCLGGGGTRSSQYVQLLCDIVGHPMAIIPEDNTTALGAAICGAVAAGLFSDIEEGAAVLSPTITAYTVPNMERHEILNQRREQFHLLREKNL